VRKKILFVNGNLAVGGVEKALVNLLNSIDRNLFDIDLLLLQPEEDYLSELNVGINIIRRNITTAFGPMIPTLLKSLRQHDIFSLTFRLCLKIGYPTLKLMKNKFGLKRHYDVAISFRPGICEEIVLNVVNATKKFTWWHHGDFNISISREKLISNWMKFDKIITVSRGIAAKIVEFSNTNPHKICVIPNIIDLAKIKSMAGEENPYGGLNKLKIVTVSRLSREKSLPTIIETAVELKKSGMEFEWTIVGDGEMRNNLENAITHNDLTNNVILVGQKDNPYPWIKYADMMVHPSKVESFGIVLLEAMALGTPCISAPSLGAFDLIDGSNGIICDNKFFVQNIIKLRRDKLLYRGCIENGVEKSMIYTSKHTMSLFNKLI